MAAGRRPGRSRPTNRKNLPIAMIPLGKFRVTVIFCPTLALTCDEVTAAPIEGEPGAMAYVSDYHHDLFVSYAHFDNEEDSQEVRWVSRFQADLKNALRQRLGAD